MFLSPSPPRLTRRSRLENILLLLLRGAALVALGVRVRPAVLAAAGAARVRPTPSSGASRSSSTPAPACAAATCGNRRLATVDEVVAECRPHDQVALFACDDTLRPLVEFRGHVPSRAGAAASGSVGGSTAKRKPTWAGTHLGHGLMDAVEIVNNVRARRPSGRIASLAASCWSATCSKAAGSTRWPTIPGRRTCELELRPVCRRANNERRACIGWPTSRSADIGGGRRRTARARVERRRFRRRSVSSCSGSTTPTERAIGKPVTAYVPAGESRVVRVRRPNETRRQPLAAERRRRDFDNTLYFATRAEAGAVGRLSRQRRADDPQGLRYYLERALTDGLSQPVQFESRRPTQPLAIESPTETPLVVVDRPNPPTRSKLATLRQYAESGGTLLFVLTGKAKPRRGRLLAESIERKPRIEVASRKRTSRTTTRCSAKSRSTIRCSPRWPGRTSTTSRRFISGSTGGSSPSSSTARTLLARFRKRRPGAGRVAASAKGRLYLADSGWHPADSQFARSWKFVLLVSALVEGGRGGRVRPRVLRRQRAGAARRAMTNVRRPSAVTKPDGTKVHAVDRRPRICGAPMCPACIRSRPAMAREAVCRESRSAGEPHVGRRHGNARTARLPTGRRPARGTSNEDSG